MSIYISGHVFPHHVSVDRSLRQTDPFRRGPDQSGAQAVQ